MPKYLIERKLSDAGKLTQDDLKAIATTSNAVLDGMHREGAAYHWVQSFVTDDAIYCVHVAPDAETALEHARRGGFPADNVMEIRSTIDPTTAE